MFVSFTGNELPERLASRPGEAIRERQVLLAHCLYGRLQLRVGRMEVCQHLVERSGLVPLVKLLIEPVHLFPGYVQCRGGRFITTFSVLHISKQALLPGSKMSENIFDRPISTDSYRGHLHLI